MREICSFIFELGQLKRIKHEGWKLIGDTDPESVAEHSLRAAQIGFILAKLEGYENPTEVCSILVFHDIGECRTGDIHVIAKRYVTADEKKTVSEQLEKLGDIGKEIFDLRNKIEYSNSKAGIIAKDADLLEMAATAREYIEKGFSSAQNWIENITNKLKTQSAKELLKKLSYSNPNDWWNGLK